MRSDQTLDESVIRAGLDAAAGALLGELTVLASVDSTNADLMRGTGLAGQAQVCLAEQQTAGRGRRGRAWRSPARSNLYMSVAWTFDGGAEAMAGLSLAVGVALYDALEQLGVGGLTLKWPNDLLRDGAKLAGVLIELHGDAAGRCRAIVGTGINVRMPAEVAREIEQPWADLADTELSRSGLASACLNHLLPLLSAYAAGGFSPWRERWEARHAYADAPVRILGSGPELTGMARGVDERGALLLQTASGMQRIQGGEVSLRAAR